MFRIHLGSNDDEGIYPGSNDDEGNMGNRIETMEERLGKENIAIRYANMDSDGIWDGNMGVKRETEAIHEKFMRWTIGLDWRIPGYMVNREIGKGLLRERTEKRACNFKRRLEKGEGGEITRKCWEKMKER